MKNAQFSVNAETGSVTATIGDTRVEISADGKTITAYSRNGIAQEVLAAAPAVEEGVKISLSKDFNTAVVNGVTLRQAPDGCLVIGAAPGTVVISKPANDTFVPGRHRVPGKETFFPPAPAKPEPPKVGVPPAPQTESARKATPPPAPPQR
jgi:hypothetical protein